MALPAARPRGGCYRGTSGPPAATMPMDHVLLDWLCAAAWTVGVPLGARVLKSWLTRRLLAAAPAAARQRGQYLLGLLAATRIGLLGLAAAALALRWLEPPARWLALLDGAALGPLLLQLGLWSGALVGRWVDASRQRALQSDPRAATALVAAAFLLRLATWLVLLLVLLDNLGVNVTALLAGLGVGGVAVGLGLQSILKDLFASLSIVLDKPFQLGHFIVVDEVAGTVENIGLKTTRVRALSGELLVFSNADLTRARLRNFQMMTERRIEYHFTLQADTDERALRQLPALLRRLVRSQPRARFERAHLCAVAGDGLRFEMIYWVTDPDYTLHMDVQQAIHLGLLRALRQRGLRLAQPLRQLVVRHGADARGCGRDNCERRSPLLRHTKIGAQSRTGCGPSKEETDAHPDRRG